VRIIMLYSRVFQNLAHLRQCFFLRPRVNLPRGDDEMARGDKSAYTDKQKRQAQHIEEGYENRGVPESEAESRAWATVNKSSGGGKKSGSGRGRATNKGPAKKGGKKGGAASGSRTASAKSASAKKAAKTRASKGGAKKGSAKKSSSKSGARKSSAKKSGSRK
jgi:plasmid stabilization system protein ParE